ncbi:restriction endonuclease subunit S [Shewanella sp. YLB-07]|uniref:restriction endonuclease subunit S n=1 Tax=Shewanella sp. YLB-07 TaxID=2601268 RepID=UPI002AD4CE1C|nr:restriction endonuclease subunit S [Shewanella sp. YLB-07]
MEAAEYSDQAKGTGGGVSKLALFRIEDTLVLNPPLPEQQKIAAILTSVDEVIEKTQAQIDNFKDLKTAMMQELLTRGVGVDGKPHIAFKDPLVGRIPISREVVSIVTT